MRGGELGIPLLSESCIIVTLVERLTILVAWVPGDLFPVRKKDNRARTRWDITGQLQLLRLQPLFHDFLT